MPGRVRIAAVLCMTLLNAACGLTAQQKRAIGAFGESTAAVGEFCGEELAFIMRDTEEMNLYIAALDTAFTSRGIDTLGAFASERSATVRIAAGNALRAYGEMLSELAEGNQEERIKKAADAFVRHTSAALGTERTEDRHEAASSLLGTLAAKLEEWKRTEAIESIVPRARGLVDRLAGMLIVDFSLDRGEWRSRGMLFAYRDTAYRLRNKAQRVTDFGGSYSVPHRLIAFEAYRHALSAVERAALVEERCRPALEELLKANAELVRVVEDKDYGIADIRNYQRQVRSLVDAIETLGSAE